MLEKLATHPPAWILDHPQATPDHLGLIPAFLDVNDPRPAAEQFDARYCSGRRNWAGNGNLTVNADGMQIVRDDKNLDDLAEIRRLIGHTQLRDELVRLYENAWVTVTQPDGSFELSHMD